MTIKYLVISGGGPNSIKALGALQQLDAAEFWNIDNIEKIYGTSAGALLAVLLAMKFELSVIADYVIKRPWHATYQFGVNQVFEAFSKKGLYDASVFEIFFKPFFVSRDLDVNNMTMAKFYEYTQIELHFYSLEINSFVVEDVSYLTHPDMLLLTAVHMTCALPIIVTPVCSDSNKCFVDGGVVCNYPLNYCLDNPGCDVNEVLGFRNEYVTDIKHNVVDGSSSILDYIVNFINKLIYNVDTEGRQITIPNEIKYKTEHVSISYIKSALSSIDARKELMDGGKDVAEKFLQELANRTTDAEV
jgi:predicted acylesterase/phospholipase RssA